VKAMVALPSRNVVCDDAFAWLKTNVWQPGTSVVTSLPDVSETKLEFEAWKVWFQDTAACILQWCAPGGFAVFFQSDIRHQGAWISKAGLVLDAAKMTNAQLVWHKIALRQPLGTLGIARPSYSHLLCFTQNGKWSLKSPGPDVFDAGKQSFSLGTGLVAARVACSYLRDNTDSHTIVDPFCGEGAILAAANACGLHAIGVERHERRVAKARSLMIREDGFARESP
jgi:hypothetical protein